MIYQCTGHLFNLLRRAAICTTHLQFIRVLMLVYFPVSMCHILRGNLTSLFPHGMILLQMKPEILGQKELHLGSHGDNQITSLLRQWISVSFCFV
jgi:hypothetical protein